MNQTTKYVMIIVISVIIILATFMVAVKLVTGKAPRLKLPNLKLNPFGSILLAIICAVGVGAVASSLTGNLYAGIGALILAVGLFFSGSTTIQIQHEGVLKILKMRIPVIYTEGWHPLIYKLIEVEPVDIRELVIPIPDKQKEHRDAFEVASGVRLDSYVELSVRAVLRYIIDDSFRYLSFNPAEIQEALVNKTVDMIRSIAAGMTDKDFMAEKDDIAKKIKDKIDVLYDCITVTSVDIPKALPADESLARAKEEFARQAALTKAQNDEFLGTNGMISRIEATKQRLMDNLKLPELEAARRAIELVQAQEGQVEIKVNKVQVDETASDLVKAASVVSTTHASATP